jgi:lipid-A-disaccharide synthase
MSSPENASFRLPPAATSRVDLLIIAGEHSGDEHAARMVRELRVKEPSLVIAALGGPELAAAGAQLLHDMTSSSVVGLVEVLKNYSFFKALFSEILRWIIQHQPRAVCFVDYPGLNLRLAATLRERGISRKGGGKVKTLYYISPQIWAWKVKRRFTMARDLDAIAVIFPFEPACYADTSLSVDFVGHPFVAPEYQSPVSYDSNGPILLLPGSRKQAVSRIFPVLLAGFRAFGRRDGVVLYPSDEILEVLRATVPPPNVQLIQISERRTRPEPMAAAAVLTSSGTMSMHCALAAIPGAIAYRANPLTYLLGRMLVNVEYLGIANLLLGEAMYPEYIQNAATPAALAGELRAATEDIARRERTIAQAQRLRTLLRATAAGSAGEWLLRQIA